MSISHAVVSQCQQINLNPREEAAALPVPAAQRWYASKEGVQARLAYSRSRQRRVSHRRAPSGRHGFDLRDRLFGRDMITRGVHITGRAHGEAGASVRLERAGPVAGLWPRPAAAAGPSVPAQVAEGLGQPQRRS